MKVSVKQEIVQLLLSAVNYRAFLSEAFELLKKQERNFSVAAFCRKAGFAARSYPGDVINGRRQITARTAPQFTRGLQLSADHARYFVLLAAEKNPELDHQRREVHEIRRAREALRSGLLKRQRRVEKNKSDGDIYRYWAWPKIFASLGDGVTGASLAEILQRSALPSIVCEDALSHMIKAEIVKLENERYFAIASHLVYPNLDARSQFRDFFVQSLDEVKSSAFLDFNSPEKLFLNSSFTVKKERLAHFREELKELLFRYIENAEDPHGEGVSSLVVGFYPNRSV